MKLECLNLKSGDLLLFNSGSINHYCNGNYGIILSVCEERLKWYNFKHKECFYTYKNYFFALKKVEL